MINAKLNVPLPVNEPVLDHAPGSAERAQLERRIGEMRATQVEIPLLIGGKEVTSNEQRDVVCPHEHGHVLARVHQASAEHVEQAVAAARDAWNEWSRLPWASRVAVFLRAADLLATKHRATINAATMLGQSKTAHQAEIDAACELIDFWRFNGWFAARMMADQPQSSAGCWNSTDWRPLEGFVLAVTPFNFTSIAGNLPTAPALLGNVVLWKPARNAALSAYVIMQVLQEAGLPAGVINFLPGAGPTISAAALGHPELSGVHFTGSTETFLHLWRTVGSGIEGYRNYPRVVGETGGKDFVVAHPSADADALMTALIRGAYEYQGQKCSAVSRAYLPRSLYRKLRDRMVAEIREIPIGDPCDFKNFMGALIDRPAFDKVRSYIDDARSSSDGAILVGGGCDDAVGYFVQPTLVEAKRPDFKLMAEEIFGPVLTCYVYPDDRFEEVLGQCDQGSPYGLTGAIFARDRAAIELASDRLRYAAGNFYINDKPTGAVVGQQPFGGSRASGTNDKAGSLNNLLRWVSPRTIKENFIPPSDYRYPYMQDCRES